MTIRFEHAEIESLLTELETTTHRGREEVLLDALRRERERTDDLARRRAEGLKIDDEFRRRLAARGPFDERSADEILGYDENGLPT